MAGGLIELDNITKVYRMGKIDVTALRGVSLTIQSGEMVAIIGASGSGKSTLLNILGCLDRPTSGKYFLEGMDVSRLNDNKLAELRSKNSVLFFRTLTCCRAILPCLMSNCRWFTAAYAIAGNGQRKHWSELVLVPG